MKVTSKKPEKVIRHFIDYKNERYTNLSWDFVFWYFPLQHLVKGVFSHSCLYQLGCGWSFQAVIYQFDKHQ